MADLPALTQALLADLLRADTDVRWLPPVLLRLLARGQPVTLTDIAAASGQAEAEVLAALAKMPDTELDDAGQVVGWGLTQRPTPHRFSVGGRELFTWCALDTLMFPALLGQPATVRSTCPATGQLVLVEVDVEPDRVTSVSPPGAVVSIVVPAGNASVRSAFCNQVHLFASADAAGPWLAEHPDASVLPVAEAFELGRPLVAHLAAGSGP